MAIVALNRLCKRYEGSSEPAVKEISLTISEGEFMVLLGPSGCGKSSVLRMIAGLEPITEGTVSINGRVVNDVPAKERDIAMVFQSYALYPHMDVYGNLAFGLRRRGVARAEIDRRVRDAAAKLGLAAFLSRKPHALSGGQRQRVALGRAIVRDPKVFLFDEPLSNLDAALRVSTRNELIRQQDELATTTIYVTHDQIEAMTMGHRICIMNKGELIQAGRPLEVYRNPADTFVARFLGNPPMNLLSAQLETNGEQVTARLAGMAVPLPGWWRSGLPGHLGSDILLGVRPEDLYESPPPALASSAVPLPVRVLAVEPLGAETLLVLALGEPAVELTARMGRDTSLARGQHASVALDAPAIHLFDPGTTKAIPRPHSSSSESIRI